MKGLLTNLPKLPEGDIIFIALVRKHMCPLSQRETLLTVFPGSLLYKHPWKNVYEKKDVNASYSEDGQKWKRRELSPNKLFQISDPQIW